MTTGLLEDWKEKRGQGLGILLRCLFLMTLLLVPFCGTGSAAEQQQEGGSDRLMVTEDRTCFPPVLMYHDVKEVPDNYFDVSVEDFRANLDWLQENGYRTLSMEEYTEIVRQGKPFPKKSLLITFDDGYRGIYDFAAPELSKRGMKATFFIITHMLGDYMYITKDELKEMAANPLFSFGSHTLTHPHLEQLEAEGKFQEIDLSRRELSELTGRQIDSIGYPYGAYDKYVIKAARAAGYTLGFAVQDRGMLHEPARYSIPRIFMGLELGKDHLDLFAKYLRSYKKMPAALFGDRWEPFEN